MRVLPMPPDTVPGYVVSQNGPSAHHNSELSPRLTPYLSTAVSSSGHERWTAPSAFSLFCSWCPS